MATITVRDLDDQVRDALRRRAAEHGRSMEAEVRAILTASVVDVSWTDVLLEIARRPRDECETGELELPPREMPRPVDLP